MRDEGGGVNRNFEARRLALIAAMLLFSVAVSAQKLVIDPTRPPVGFGSGAADTESDTAGGIRLQSVMISPTQSTAIINGVMVRLGEKYGDAVLVRVAESEVVLRSGDAQQVLKIHPGVEKREITPVALAAPAAVKSAPRKAKATSKAKAKAKPRRDVKPPADAGAPVRQGARP
jgi:MSHA biogenesis protein MshK